jgi:hypothetical protein
MKVPSIDRETFFCLFFWVLFFWFIVEEMGIAGLLRIAINPQLCMSKTKEPFANETFSFLSDLEPKNGRVGFGSIGRDGNLGFEGRCVTIDGRRHFHSLGLHPPGRGKAFVDFRIDAKWHTLSTSVAINDRNNMFGSAGSDLIFQAIGDGKLLWSSKKIRVTKHVEQAKINVEGVTKLRLEVKATASNACAHAVWVDPLLTTS